MEVIGSGAFGVVYRAVWWGARILHSEMSKLLGKFVVMCCVLPEPLAPHCSLISSHMCILTSKMHYTCTELHYRHVQHPNVLCLLGTIQSETSITVVTNFVDGMVLHTRIFDISVERVWIVS